jgi:glutamyl-tRNA(Gln) amidotransferase subunit D
MDETLKSGDRVRVELDEKVLEGVFMLRPDLADKEHIVLKLPSGYNIGIEKSRIKRVTVIERYHKKAEESTKPIAFQSGKPLVSILSTGGTISSKVDYRTGGVYASYTAEDLIRVAPELNNFANLKSTFVMNIMSEDMNKEAWIHLANAIAQELNEGSSGVVVTHGTDTLHYSTALMSFMLKNLSKPVVFTGSQRSSDRGSSDSFLNIICSTAFAASGIAGVYLVMHGSMSDNYCLAHIGTKVRKMHTSRRDAFRSINARPAAKILANGSIKFFSDLPKSPEGRFEVDAKIEERVALIKVHPNMNPKVIDFYMNEGYSGIVFEGTALGHVPTRVKEKSLIPAIERARDKGISMVMTTQSLFGRVNPYVYSNLRELSTRGVVFCEDMLPETAYMKLMWVLGHTSKPDEVKDLMLKNVAGEITERTSPDEDFLPEL